MQPTPTQTVAYLIRSMILFAAEVAFVALAAKALIDTWDAPAGTPPDLPSVQVAGLGGLALVLGGGFALILGVDTTNVEGPGVRAILTGATEATVQKLLLTGVIVYMLVCFVILATYAFAENETPAVLKTISVAFAGYVVSYISSAYKQLTT